MRDHSFSAQRIIDLVANKWTIPVMNCLVAGGKRPSEMLGGIDGISQKMLLQTLRQMEARGLVLRKVHAVVPPRVDYRLTPLGQALLEPLDALGHWAETHAREINRQNNDVRRKPAAKRPVPRGNARHRTVRRTAG